MNTDPYIHVRVSNRCLLLTACLQAVSAVGLGIEMHRHGDWLESMLFCWLLVWCLHSFASWLMRQKRLKQRRREFKMQRRAHFMLVDELRREGVECHVKRMRVKRPIATP